MTITLDMHVNAPQAKSLWSDGMILASVRDCQGLTPQARKRALELVDRGLIDADGLWKLTPAGAALADS